MVANGVSRSNYNRTLVGNLKGLSAESNNDISSGCPPNGGWCEEMMPRGGQQLGAGGSAFSEVDRSAYPRATKLTMHAYAKGYAYSAKGATTKLSIAVLLIYSTLAMAHWIYLVVRGVTSSSWDSNGEVAALALNSERSARLCNTGAGIESCDLQGEG